MAYPLKTNLANKTNATLTSLDDTLLDDNFAKSLETLINGWTQNSTYKITLSNTSDKNKYAIQYTATAGNDPGEYKLRDYVTDKINPSITNGQLNVDTTNKKITYTQKEATKKKDGASTSTSTTASKNSSESSSSSSIDSLAQQLKQGGVFDNPLTADVALKGYNTLSEEILRVKKLMRL